MTNSDDQNGPDPLATADPVDPMMTVDPFESYDPEMHDANQMATMLPEEPVPSTPAFALATLDSDDESAIEEVCSKFESAWDSGKQEPQVESFVSGDFDPSLRETLVQRLILLDIEQRKKRDKTVVDSEYLSKLPEFRDAVASVLSFAHQAPTKIETKPKSSLPRGYGSVSVPEASATTGVNPLHALDSTTRYRATKMHAKGGLGAVFSARDEELNRVVALKEILPEHSSNPRYQEKFVFEAEVTGSLEHPGIVPVYGLGRYEDQQPYYAMRFIRGHSFRNVIQKFHEEHSSPTSDTYFSREYRSLLRRLVDSCNAMHFAHEHGVLHRDIKPDNIMLGDFGETLVVDWGLAKLVEENDGDGLATKLEVRSSVASESQGCAVGTPMYMSPEQAKGLQNQLDRRTDVYALGAVLFNITSGNYPVEGVSTPEIILKVRSGNTRELRSLAPAAPRAIASICLKAMALEPGDRYRTAVELAEDIERWMNDEVPLAHVGRESFTEKAARLIRRYKSWTISGAVALLLVTAVAIGASVLINGARKNEKAAKEQTVVYKKDAIGRYQDSRSAIDTWLVQGTEALGFFPGTQAVQMRLLQVASEDYERLSKRESGDPELELERGRALVRLGDLHRMMQAQDEAIVKYQAAEKFFKSEQVPGELEVRFQSEYANVQARIGLAFAEKNDFSKADESFNQAISQLKTIVDKTPDPLPTRLLAAAHVNAGEYGADFEVAASHLEQGLGYYRELKVEGDSKLSLNMARSQELLGRVYTKLGNHELAVVNFNESIETLEQLVAAEEDNPDFLNALASTHISQASSFRVRGLNEQQVESLRTAVIHFKALRIAMPGVPRYDESLGITQTDLGITLHELGQNEAALATLQLAQKALTDLVESYGKIPAYRVDYAVCLDAISQVMQDTSKETQPAVSMAAGSLGTFQRLVQRMSQDQQSIPPKYFEQLAISQSHYARALVRHGDADAAKQHFGGAIQALEDLMANQGRLPTYVNALAHVRYHFGLTLHEEAEEQAAEQFTLARDLWMEIEAGGAAEYKRDLAWLLLACPNNEVRDPEAALRLANDAVELAPENARYLTLLALANVQSRDLEAAKPLVKKAIGQRGSSVDRDLYVQALIQHQAGEVEQAEQTLAEAEKWREKNRPFNADVGLMKELIRSVMEKDTN
ncbi:MAG: protein kinase [Rubripirellula sp.]